jgi:hypothetical protein
MRGHLVRWRGKRAGYCSYGASAAGRCRASGTGFACRLGMDTGILPLAREAVYLGPWALGGPTPASRDLGARPMGSSRWRLGLGQRILALESVCEKQDFGTRRVLTHPLKPGISLCVDTTVRLVGFTPKPVLLSKT